MAIRTPSNISLSSSWFLPMISYSRGFSFCMFLLTSSSWIAIIHRSRSIERSGAEIGSTTTADSIKSRWKGGSGTKLLTLWRILTSSSCSSCWKAVNLDLFFSVMGNSSCCELRFMWMTFVCSNRLNVGRCSRLIQFTVWWLIFLGWVSRTSGYRNWLFTVLRLDGCIFTRVTCGRWKVVCL